MPILEAVSDDFLGLSGFQQALEPAQIAALGEDAHEPLVDALIAETLADRLGPLSVRLRGINERPFEALNVLTVSSRAGQLSLHCHSDDRHASVVLELDFASGSLRADFARGLERIDSGTFRSAALMAARNRFVGKLLEGAVLEVVDADERVLGRSAPLTFHHVDLAPALRSYRAFARSWEAIAANRLLKKTEPRGIEPVAWLGSTFLSRVAQPAF
ncbi:hypothetical protein AB7M35_000263 [Amorphus suaedae]